MGESIANLLKGLPQRFTASDRLKDFATEKSKVLIAELSENPNALLESLGLGRVKFVCKTDGLRLTAETGDIVHLRPSGNAPELRCYVEAGSLAPLTKLLVNALSIVKKRWANA
jgi:phosphomannomutase